MLQKIREEIKKAMIEKKETGKSDRLQTLKNILETAQKVAKDKRTDEITDSMIIDAAKREIKQLNDLLEYCEKDSDKYKETMVYIGVAEEILPKMASEDEIKAFITEHESEIGNIGAAMKLLKAHFGDSLDGKLASNVARNVLAR